MTFSFLAPFVFLDFESFFSFWRLNACMLVLITQPYNAIESTSHNPPKMRRNKSVARILLIFSIASVVLAAPAVVRQRTLITDVPDDESTDESMPSIETASDLSESSAPSGWVHQAPPSQVGLLHESPVGPEQDWVSGLPSGSMHQDWLKPAAPPPPPARLHHDWAWSHASLSDESLSQDSESSHDTDLGSVSSQLHDDPPSWSGFPQLGDPRPGPGIQPLYEYPPPASGAAQLHDAPPSRPGAVPLRNDPLSGLGAQLLHEDPQPLWGNWHPVMEIEQALSSRLQLSHLQPEALEASRISGASLESGWADLLTSVAEPRPKKPKIM